MVLERARTVPKEFPRNWFFPIGCGQPELICPDKLSGLPGAGVTLTITGRWYLSATFSQPGVDPCQISFNQVRPLGPSGPVKTLRVGALPLEIRQQGLTYSVSTNLSPSGYTGAPFPTRKRPETFSTQRVGTVKPHITKGLFKETLGSQGGITHQGGLARKTPEIVHGTETGFLSTVEPSQL